MRRMPLPVLVSDTNIWIDLENSAILAEVFKLPYKLITTDLAAAELIRPEWSVLESFGLEVVELSAEQILELYRIRSIHRNFSVADISAFLAAKDLGATLLTGESMLTKFARDNLVKVHGALWLLDEMVRLHIIALNQAAAALQRMLEHGARLPAEECNKRFAMWSE